MISKMMKMLIAFTVLTIVVSNSLVNQPKKPIELDAYSKTYASR